MICNKEFCLWNFCKGVDVHTSDGDSTPWYKECKLSFEQQIDSQDLRFWAIENNDRDNNERCSLCRHSRVDGSWTYPQWALLWKVWHLQLRCNNVGTLHFNQTLGRSTAWTGNITHQEENAIVTLLCTYITSFCMFSGCLRCCLWGSSAWDSWRAIGKAYCRSCHFSKCFFLSYVLESLFGVMECSLWCFADCWTEPEQRPRCSDILSRLMDCEYALC